MCDLPIMVIKLVYAIETADSVRAQGTYKYVCGTMNGLDFLCYWNVLRIQVIHLLNDYNRQEISQR